MKVLKNLFVAIFVIVFTTVNVFGAQNCENANYRRAYPEKCKSSNNTTLLTLAGGAVLVGTGVDSVYGWGLLNLEKATQPVGTPKIVLSNDTIRPLTVSYITGAAAPAVQKANIKTGNAGFFVKKTTIFSLLIPSIPKQMHLFQSPHHIR